MSGKYDRLAAMIVKAREARGWSQSDLASLAYVTEVVIARVEAGNPPNAVALKAVEQALGWLPGIFDLILGEDASTENGVVLAAEGDDEDDGSAELRELTVDSSIDWA
ncbi:helix-turn-helix domain-containing protein [Catenulispora rubra]|uniref:helix-turn-helix domain-containing protein n=1 Tax=Catenulispora rubra TaxID=280293 RepID=UPI001892306B|nr:helix-turn-helix domain-containing protein [Catenulispora rubra]